MHNEQSEVYIQAKLMFIQTIGKQNVYFAGALAPNFEQSEKLLPIVYISLIIIAIAIFLRLVAPRLNSISNSTVEFALEVSFF